MGSHQRCLNQKRAAAAEGIHENPIRSPGRQHQEGSRQCLGNGSLAGPRPIPPFVQGLSCGVQGHGNLILHQKQTHRKGGPILRKPLPLISLLHPLYHGFLSDGLYIGNAVQLTLDGRRLRNPEFPVFRKIFLPGQRLDPRKQFLKTPGRKTPYLYQDPFRCAKKNIPSADSLRVAEKGYPAILHPGYLISQIIDFSLQHSFQPEMAGRNHFHCLHCISSVRFLIS